MQEGICVNVIEIVLIFRFCVEIADFFHGGICVWDDFGLDGVDDGIFADHVAVEAVRNEGDFVSVNIDELKEHHIIENWWDMLKFGHVF